jgi:hypothetical protein
LSPTSVVHHEVTDTTGLSAGVRAHIAEASRRLPSSLRAVVAAWFVYLLLLGILRARWGPVALLLVPTVGVYLFTWLGYYRHELWHAYFPGVDNGRWFTFVSYMLFADPQVYRLAHGSHHKFVHTPGDLEFFCVNWENDLKRRRRHFLAELVFGNLAWELTTLARLLRAGRASVPGAVVATAWRIALLAAVVGACQWIAPGSGWRCLGGYWLTIWLGSVMTRQNQWIEHLGIVDAGGLADRNLLTRNLSSRTWAGWLFNLVNHGDAREHVYHHTEPRWNTRDVPDLGLPPGSPSVTIGQYYRVLLDYHRRLDAT